MTASLCVAAFLMAAPGIAHSILGERHILIRLFRLDKSLVISRGQHLSWLVFVVIGGLVLV